MCFTILGEEYTICSICLQPLPTNRHIIINKIDCEDDYNISVCHQKCKDLESKIKEMKQSLVDLEYELYLLQHPD